MAQQDKGNFDSVGLCRMEPYGQLCGNFIHTRGEYSAQHVFWSCSKCGIQLLPHLVCGAVDTGEDARIAPRRRVELIASGRCVDLSPRRPQQGHVTHHDLPRDHDCFHLIEFLVATKVGRNMDRPLIIPLFVKRDFPCLLYTSRCV